MRFGTAYARPRSKLIGVLTVFGNFVLVTVVPFLGHVILLVLLFQFVRHRAGINSLHDKAYSTKLSPLPGVE